MHLIVLFEQLVVGLSLGIDAGGNPNFILEDGFSAAKVLNFFL